MNTDCARRHAAGFRALASALLVLNPALGTADDASCVPPPSEAGSAAAGQWKGTMTLAVEMQAPGAPPVKLGYSGDLDLALKYDVEVGLFTEPQPCLRLPHGFAPKPGCDSSGQPVGDGPADKATLVSRPVAAHVDGTAKVSSQFLFDSAGMSASMHVMESLNTPTPTALAAHEDSAKGPVMPLAVILLRGSPSQFAYLLNASMTDRSGWISSTGTDSAAGGAMNSVGMQDGKPVSSSNRLPGSSAPQASQEAVLFRLVINEQDCWRMRGAVDTAGMAASVQSGGMSFKVVDSAWQATLVDTDESVKQELDRFMSRPVPAQLSDADVEEARTELARLRGKGNPTDAPPQRQCAADTAISKLLAVNERLLKNLIDDYPKVSDGATAPVLCAAATRLVGLMHEMSVLADECPLVSSGMNRITSEWDALGDRGANCGRPADDAIEAQLSQEFAQWWASIKADPRYAPKK